MHTCRANAPLCWAMLHWVKPYPDRDQQRAIAIYTCKSRQQVVQDLSCYNKAFRIQTKHLLSDQLYLQVADWFTNWRARTWKQKIVLPMPVWHRVRAKVQAILAFMDLYRIVQATNHTHEK